jgi:hypothetical protein
MRFPADDIWKVRLGEQTRLSIPYERKPCPFKAGGYYVLERTLDVREVVPCEKCETGYTKRGKPCALCGGHRQRIVYKTRVERVEGEERVEVLDVAKVSAESFTDLWALEEGWESAEEWRDAFFATHGEHERIWTLRFQLTSSAPQFMAVQHGRVDPPQYVSSPSKREAIDDADAPTATEYRNWAEKADAEYRRRRELDRLESRRRSLDEQIDQLKRKAA